MIRLERGVKVPAKLERDGETQTAHLIEAFENGDEIKPNNNVYGHDSVKTLLKEIQHNKCAYCETKLAQQFGDIEHFRPKKAWQSSKGEPQSKPGYFWLAYEWENLLLTCEVCNTRYKGNHFPLADESKRADPKARDTSQEEPLLLNPYDTDPDQHLEYDLWDIRPREGSIIGQTSIDGYGLASYELIQGRRSRIEETEILLDLAENADRDQFDLAPTIEYLKSAIEPSSEYSAAVRANFGERILKLVFSIETDIDSTT